MNAIAAASARPEPLTCPPSSARLLSMAIVCSITTLVEVPVHINLGPVLCPLG